MLEVDVLAIVAELQAHLLTDRLGGGAEATVYAYQIESTAGEFLLQCEQRRS